MRFSKKQSKVISLYDQKSVLIMFKIFDSWFEPFKANKLSIPTNFSPNIILNIMVVLFNTQESLAITTSIYFWYEFCAIFDVETNALFLNQIVRYFFFKLILHWSKPVREAFLYFICFKVVLLIELNICNDNFRNLLTTINQYLNVLKLTSDTYQKALYNYENLNRKDRRKLSILKIKERVLQKINSCDKKTLITDFFNNVSAFKVQFKDYLHSFNTNNDYFHTPSIPQQAEELNDSFESFADENDIIPVVRDANKLRLLRVNSRNFTNFVVSSIGVDQVQYSTLALFEFKDQMMAYQRLKTEFPGLKVNDLPKLKMKLPIDEFEFLDESDTAW